MHLYERHYKRARLALRDDPNITAYDYVNASPCFTTDFSELDVLLYEFFSVEKNLRDIGDLDFNAQLVTVKDPLFQVFARMLGVFINLKTHRNIEQIIQLLASIPPCDLRLAALEFLLRHLGGLGGFELADGERAFLERITFFTRFHGRINTKPTMPER